MTIVSHLTHAASEKRFAHYRGLKAATRSYGVRNDGDGLTLEYKCIDIFKNIGVHYECGM